MAGMGEGGGEGESKPLPPHLNPLPQRGEGGGEGESKPLPPHLNPLPQRGEEVY